MPAEAIAQQGPQRQRGPQRALADALKFAEQRVAFGKPIIQHPLMRRQFEARFAQLWNARALMREVIELLDEVWRRSAPKSLVDERDKAR